METAIYVRVSTEEQVQDGFSIRAQEQKLRDYARIKDWSIHNIYMDEGISGKNMKDRPAIRHMIEAIQSGTIKNVLVYKIDRLTRSTADLIYLIDLFNQYECSFNSLMESIDTQTASGRMFLKIIGIFAEFERENIIERVSFGRERKVREGYTLCSSPSSYGYDRERGQRIQTINEKEAQIVREIFDMYVNQNMSLNSIVKVLNIRGIPTKKNSLWQRRTIKDILSNCNYIGKVRHFMNDNKKYFENIGLHEPIISEELFYETQQLLAKSRKIHPTKRAKECNYYLGILFCIKCGRALGTHGRYRNSLDGSTKYNGAYRCRNSSIGHCYTGDISHKNVNAAFKDCLSSIAEFNVIDEVTITKQEKARSDNEMLTEQYHKKLSELSSKERSIINLYVDNKIDFDNYKHMKRKIKDIKTCIATELKKLNLKEDRNDILVKKEDIILNLCENWEILTDIEKRQFLTKFVKKITISSKKSKERNGNIVAIESVEFNCI